MASMDRWHLWTDGIYGQMASMDRCGRGASGRHV